MPKATPEQTRKANRAAAVVSLFVVAFAIAFMGLVAILDNTATQRQEEEVVIAPEPPTEPFYVLLIGSDTRKGTALYTGKPTEHAQVDQHSDVMTLMRIDPKEYTISLLTIPRDTIISDGSEKINCALLGDDPEEVVRAVYELTGLEADYYMLTTFGMFANLIDAIGGVTMDVPVSVEASDPTTGGTIRVEAGPAQKLDGAHALALARARSEYVDNQDAMRQMNVRMLEQAIIERMLEGDGIGIEALLVVLEGDVRTNMDLGVLGQAVLDFIENADKVKIYSGTGPYDGDVRVDDEQWVIPNDADAWKRIMRKFKLGKEGYAEVVPQPEPPSMPEPEEKSSSSASASSKSASSKSASSKSASSSSASKESDAKRLSGAKTD
ncbi:MAG: LCP family protein [Eggerthellaceae bacterium]|nr:LCP family protein [Eggerthellaceae bacterium]